jgi:hypothetical protein
VLRSFAMATKKGQDDATKATRFSEPPKEPRRKMWLRVHDSELAAWDKAAATAGMETGPWLRALANKAAGRTQK